MPNYGSLSELSAPTSRILSREKIEDLKEPKRWRQQYLGPFDGILGSFLTCQSCSSEVVLHSFVLRTTEVAGQCIKSPLFFPTDYNGF